MNTQCTRKLPLHGRSTERKRCSFRNQVKSQPYIRPICVQEIIALASIEAAGRNLICQSALTRQGSFQDLGVAPIRPDMLRVVDNCG